eukprot:Phypoly_transcript_13500.p1 GENE.Phypoly_transcript_13500~~Phypoly_transcript_13500.p1  ORF type:complete len:244 (+),score=28.20 Phypoly_transcript_13500:313-1044(+)
MHNAGHFAVVDAFTKESIYWGGVVASLRSTLQNEICQSSEMARVTSSIVPLIDKGFELLLVDHLGHIVKDRNVAFPEKANSLVGSLEDARPDFLVGAVASKLGAQLFHRKLNEYRVGAVVLPFLIGEESKKKNKDYKKVAVLMQAAYNMQELALGEHCLPYVLGYSFVASKLSFFALFKHQDKYPIIKLVEQELREIDGLLAAAHFITKVVQCTIPLRFCSSEFRYAYGLRVASHYTTMQIHR